MDEEQESLEMTEGYHLIQPFIDAVLANPTTVNLKKFVNRCKSLKRKVLQNIHRGIIKPLHCHLVTTQSNKKNEVLRRVVDTINEIISLVTLDHYESVVELEKALSQIISKSPGMMVADIPEELKLSIVQCLLSLSLRKSMNVRKTMLKQNLQLLGMLVYVLLNIAKMERLRKLRMTAVECVLAITATHPQFTDENYHIVDVELERVAMYLCANILPGVLQKLTDVCHCKDNPGQALMVLSVEAIHRILCITMHDKCYTRKENYTTEDFVNLYEDMNRQREAAKKDAESKDAKSRTNEAEIRKMKNTKVFSAEWYEMAGPKLKVLVRNVAGLRINDNNRVKKEVAIFCARLLKECYRTMQWSASIALDTLVCFTRDGCSELEAFSAKAVRDYMKDTPQDIRKHAMDGICEKLFGDLVNIPQVLLEVDTRKKVTALNLIGGYLALVCGEQRPQRLTLALRVQGSLDSLLGALREAASLQRSLSLLRIYATRNVTCAPPEGSPWAVLHHVGGIVGEQSVRRWCQALGAAECADLVLDVLLDRLIHQRNRDPETIYIINWMVTGPEADPSLCHRVLPEYLEENVWYQSFLAATSEPPLTPHQTWDADVYNPRAWTKDSVPGLYEGTVETRYTDISLRVPIERGSTSDRKPTVGRAQDNMLFCCLLTEGVGMMALRLKKQYNRHLVNSINLILERVGSAYEMLSQAGLKALNNLATAGGHDDVMHFISINGDYITSQISSTLKKIYDTPAALQIFYVVMKYSDSSMMNCLEGIIKEVLYFGFNKFQEDHLHTYMLIFDTFFECIQKWYPQGELEIEVPTEQTFHLEQLDIMGDVTEYAKNKEEAERLLEQEQEAEDGKSAQEMYEEDLSRREEEDVLDYDDAVTDEKEEPPHYLSMVYAVLQRCINFIGTKQMDQQILVLQAMNSGIPLLRKYPDLLLPLVAEVWSPLASVLACGSLQVQRRAHRLVVTLAAATYDFIRARTAKDCIPHLLNLMRKSESESMLKEPGSSYRSSPEYKYLETVVASLASLVVHLDIEGPLLDQVMSCVDIYLSRKQPKPLQESAVKFYKALLIHNYGATWYHLRSLCNNKLTLDPPPGPIPLQPLTGTPYDPANPLIRDNLRLIFNVKKK